MSYAGVDHCILANRMGLRCLLMNDYNAFAGEPVNRQIYRAAER